MKELKYIYLEPSTCACPSDGAMWCEDMQTCDNCGRLYTQYIRTDLSVSISKIQELIKGSYLPDGETLRAVRADDIQTLIDSAKGGDNEG